jgi:hypothetical protein
MSIEENSVGDFKEEIGYVFAGPCSSGTNYLKMF